MPNFSKLIGELRIKIDHTEQSVERQTQRLGEIILNLEESVLEDTPLVQPYAKARRLLAMVENNRTQMRHIDDLVNQLAEVGATLQKTQSELERTEREFDAHYEEVGQAAYRVFQENRDQQERYENLFADIVRLEEEIRNLEHEIVQIVNIQKKKGGILLKFQEY